VKVTAVLEMALGYTREEHMNQDAKRLVIIDMSDVRALRLECMSCLTAIECAPKEMQVKALTCPNCERPLIQGGDSPGFVQLGQLAEALKLLSPTGELAPGADYAGRARGKIRLIVAVPGDAR
jgi:hypothetical protein